MSLIPVNVLVVEDSPTDADILRRVFLRAGIESWTLTIVERLSEGIEQATQHPFDVVLLDLHLPDTDGIETVVQCREALPNLPIVILTVSNDEELALQSMANGAQDYLVKDEMTISSILRAIRYAIEREKTAKQLRETLEKERELNQLKSNFISMVSHEFKNPLTVIKMSVELLRLYHSELNDQKIKQHFNRITEAVNYQLNLLEEVLTLGRAESGKMTCNLEIFNLQEFIVEMVEMVRLTAGAGHEINVHLQGVCDHVCLDRDLFQHIVTNLLSNAVKYSPQGGVVYLGLNCQPEGLTLTVQDSGIGIPESDLSQLFEVFHRGSNVHKLPGTGLGLSIVKKCVDLHQGTITVQSQLGVGTTFRVFIPQFQSFYPHPQNSSSNSCPTSA